MKRREGGWLLAIAGLVLAGASCDDGNDYSQLTGFNLPVPGADAAAEATRCVPGQTRACLGVCSGFGLGYQVCASDGLSYGACDCPPEAPIASIDTPGRATIIPPRNFGEGPPVLAPGGVRPVPATIGASCERDADCGGGLNCFGAANDSLGFGGPAGGYCSMGCNGTDDCTQVDPGATCGAVSGRSICLQTCLSGAPASSADKCLGRPDLSCLSMAVLGDAEATGEPQLGICAPRCQSDAGCAGRRCDLSIGLCTDEPRAGDPIGAACDTPAGCAAGLCLGASEETSGVCSAFCTVGVAGCGFDGSEVSVDAGCVLPQIPSEGAGDRGLCFELCDVASDCTEPGFSCVPEPTNGRAGVCLPGPAASPPGGPGAPELPDAEGLAQPCEDDSECVEGLVCLAVGDDPFGVGGGPAQGYCSSPCDAAEECPLGAACAQTAGGGFCLKTCDPDAPGDCGVRDAVSCVSIGAVGACVPNCVSDEQCGDRVCNVEVGLCFDAPEPEPLGCTTDAGCAEGVCDPETGQCVPEPEPEPLGCTTDADCSAGFCDIDSGTCTEAPAGCTGDEDCADGVCNVLDGLCIELSAQPIGAACVEDIECTGPAPAEDETRLCLTLGDSSFCSGGCVWGTPFGCEAYGADAFCILPVQGDIGACLELCNLPDECEQAGYDCVSIGTSVNGRTGACLPPQPAE